MALDELARHVLHRALREVLGDDAAATLMEYLPPTGWADVATKRDLDQLALLTKRDIDDLRTEVKHDIDDLRTGVKHDIDDVKRDIAEFRAAVDQRFDASEHRMRSETRAEINAALTSQTRTLLFALVGSNVTVGALAFAAAGLR